jgi:PEP-CTERM motif
MKIALLAVAAQLLTIVGNAHAGTATHVPEPASLALLSAGAAVVAVGAWWRNRK